MKRFLLVLGVSALLLGCGSAVKLDEVPVEDRSGVAVSQPGTGSGTGVGTGGVAAVDVGQAGQQGALPAGARIVYFDYDSYVIKPEFQSVIETHARFIKSNRQRRVALEGHTDERGGREYNLALGQRRAEAVRTALGLLGVADAQMEAVSFGKEKPAVPGSSESAMAQNRRTEISYR